MSYYLRVGDIPRKRHIWHRGPDGNRLAEELMGEEGFNGSSSLLYHQLFSECHHRGGAGRAGAFTTHGQRSPAALAFASSLAPGRR